MNLTRMLYSAARLSATARSLRSPKTAARRARNLATGRLLGRLGVWRRLWR
ncbi:MAG TPA: hypothetical protein VNG93_07220 [Candidatus Dormibacteraeota bacterium]|nr:hypothetical protein [Candidatus Dormibacteraeota bacterium]